MKRFLATVLTVILTIMLVVGAAAGFILYHKYKPSKEHVDQKEWYQASGDETAVFFNSERVDTARSDCIRECGNCGKQRKAAAGAAGWDGMAAHQSGDCIHECADRNI